jgi:hypothetical protein
LDQGQKLDRHHALPEPDIMAAVIADDLEAAVAQFTKIAVRLGQTGRSA